MHVSRREILGFHGVAAGAEHEALGLQRLQRLLHLAIHGPGHELLERGTEHHQLEGVDVLEAAHAIDVIADVVEDEAGLVDARVVELYVLRDLTYFIVLQDREGRLRSPLFDMELCTAPGPKLRMTWADGSVEL